MTMHKTVQVVGHQFDAVAAHVTVAARGSGGNLRIAVTRAIGALLSDPRLKHRQIGEFKMSVVVISDRAIGGGEGGIG
jgi:hypothetical protein